MNDSRDGRAARCLFSDSDAREAAYAGIISAPKLSAPPTALMANAARVRRTGSSEPPLSSENAGANPSRLMDAAAKKGAAMTASAVMVAPSSASAASAWRSLAPRALSSAISPPRCSAASADSVAT